MDLSDFYADTDLQRDGVTIPFGSWTEITIRSAADEKFASYWNKLKKPHQKEIDAEKLPERVGRELLARAISQRLIVGWKFLVMPKVMLVNEFEEGEIETKPAKHDDFDREMVEVVYSKSNCFAIMKRKAFNSFRAWVMNQATDIANFQHDDFEDDLGN
jgi:hypothetical protein